MSEMISQEINDTLDDLRSLGAADTVEDSLDDLRSLTDDTPTLMETASDSSASTEPVSEDTKAESVVTRASQADVKEVVSPTPSAASITPSEVVTQKPATVTKPIINPTPVVSSSTPEPQVHSENSYNPSFTLKVFTILRHGFIVLFDIVLTGVAIVVEKLAQIDWAGMLNKIGFILGKVDEQIQNRLARKFRLTLYVTMLLLVLGLPISMGVFSIFSGDKPSTQANSSQIVAISQGSITTDNGILAPLFTPMVQFWADDIARWTANTAISPDMFAVVMQLESCGNPSVEGGLFGIADANSSFNDPETDALLALARLQNALTLSNNDFGMALAIYADGESVLQNDFTTWSFHGRDMYILGRNFYYQAQQGMPNSPDLSSWMQNTGAILCTQAQTTLNG